MRVCIILFIAAVSLFGQSIGIISDDKLKPPDYNSFNPPQAVLSTYTDPVFGTEIRRLTSDHHFLDDGHIVLGGYFANSEICYFNKDGTYFIACENEIINGKFKIGLYLYNGITGERLRFLGLYGVLWRPFTLRWALGNYYTKNGQKIYFDPNTHFYQYYENQVRLYNIDDLDNYVVLHTFDEYAAIGPAGGEGDVSDDGRYWIFDGDATELFVYDLLDDIKYQPTSFDIGSLGCKNGQVGVDYAAISAGGEYAIVAWGTSPGVGKRYAGIELYDKNFNFLRQLHPGIIHWETGIDVNGDEVIYSVATFESPDYWKPAGAKPGDLVSIRCSDARILLLKSIPSWAHVMFSACNFDSDKKYLYATYMEHSDNPNTMWEPFWGEILEVPTDGSQRVRRLVHTRSHFVPNMSTKYYQPDVVVNHQGTRMVFRSTYNFGAGDLYMFDIIPRDGSQQDDIPPNPPLNLRGLSIQADRVSFAWDAPAAASDGDTPEFYKVYRDDVFMSDVFTTLYTDSSLHEGESHVYAVTSVDDFGNESTALSQSFTTTQDLTPPQPVYTTLYSKNAIRIIFSEALESNGAQNVSNYSVNNGLTLSEVTLLDSNVVVLHCSAMQRGQNYIISMSNLKDNSFAKNVIADNTSITLKTLSFLIDDFENGLQSNTWVFYDDANWQIVTENDQKCLGLVKTDYRLDDSKRIGEWALMTNSNAIGAAYELQCDVKSIENLATNPNADYAIVFSFQNMDNHAYIQFQPNDVRVNQILNGQRAVFETYSTDYTLDEYQHVRLVVQNTTAALYINNAQVMQYQFGVLPLGRVGFGSYNDAACFDNVNFGSLVEDVQSPKVPTGLTVE